MPEVRRNPQALKPRLALGVAQFLAGRENEAIDTLMQAVELAPDDSLPYFLLAEAATQSAPRILEIRAKLKRFVGLNPADAAAHFHYAQTLQGDAEAELRAAIALKPDFARAHSTLAVLLEERGDDESAIAAYKESLRLVPDASDVLYRLAQAYKRIGQTEQSRQTLASFLKQREREQSEADRHRADMLQLLPAPCAP